MQRYGPELDHRLRRRLKPTNKSWRVDEIYIKVKGRWCYLNRAIDLAGATIDFLLSAFRDADAAKRLFRKALSARSHPQPAEQVMPPLGRTRSLFQPVGRFRCNQYFLTCVR